jgi:hypothetical protein
MYLEIMIFVLDSIGIQLIGGDSEEANVFYFDHLRKQKWAVNKSLSTIDDVGSF